MRPAVTNVARMLFTRSIAAVFAVAAAVRQPTEALTVAALGGLLDPVRVGWKLDEDQGLFIVSIDGQPLAGFSPDAAGWSYDPDNGWDWGLPLWMIPFLADDEVTP